MHEFFAPHAITYFVLLGPFHLFVIGMLYVFWHGYSIKLEMSVLSNFWHCEF